MALSLKKIDLKDFDLRTVYEWPLYGRLFIFAWVCVGVFYFGYYFDFSALSDQIVARYKQELDLKEQVTSILKTEEAMKEVVLQFPEVLKLVNQWQGQLINGAKLPDLLNQILKIGAANHLQFSLFAPGAKKSEGDYFVVPLKVVVQGNYSQVAQFFSQLANMPQIVAISDFIIVKGSHETGTAEKTAAETSVAHPLTTAVTLEVYYLANKKQ